MDVLRDQDSVRDGVPGTALDGDGDGVPGGVHNFWFETRSLQRMVTIEGDGQRVVDGQVVTITSGSGVVRQYEFADITLTGGPGTGVVAPGNIKVEFDNADTVLDIADQFADAIDGQVSNTGVEVEVDETGAVPVLKFSGERSVEFSADLDGMEIIGRTIFVDKLATPFAQGTLDSPFNNVANPDLANAFGSAAYGDIIRIVGNGGLDNDITTENDNLSYEVGTAETGGAALSDGRSMNVPKGVTTMIDAGAIFKLRNSYINVGSSTVQVDRSNAALQVLGTPRLVQLSPSGDPVSTTLLGNDDQFITEGYSDGSVIFTSTRDRLVDESASGISPAPAPGNWGGIIFRRDIDRAEGRRDREDDGIFLQTVNHAEMRYGGGSNVLIDSVQQLVNPVQIVDMRPTVTFNRVTFSADSAISAAPNSFEETSFQAPTYQRGGAFTADYDRVGPDIRSNLMVENSINGLFVRVTTTPVDPPKEFTVSARFDDTDVVHYVAENLSVVGTPGGSIEDDVVPSWRNVTFDARSGGSLVGGTTYEYKLTFVDADGFESAASAAFPVTIDAAFSNASVALTSLDTVGGLDDYVSRRLYRAEPSAPGEFFLIAELDAGSVDFIDDGSRQDAFLDPAHDGVRGRLNASLVMDAGLIVKLRGSRIELGHGTQLLAEAHETNPIVFTSSLDDRFGAGGSFDTNNDEGNTSAQRGDWSGIYASPNSTLSFDHVLLANAGGISLLRGGLARGFAPIELTQAEARITNSRFESNDTGQDGAGPAGRFGLLSLNGVQVSDPFHPLHVRDAISTIMVRGSQPVIVGNTFYDNRGTIINIDVESMGANHRVDPGRSTGEIDRYSGLDDNFGPLIRYNRYENIVAQSLNRNDNNSQLSGLEVRGGHITTETIFDDTDIAHLLFDNIEVGNFESSGGLTLKSRPDESLVVKFSGPGTPNSASEGTGITASGQQGDASRIGGTVHILGLPGAPVVLTSIHDDAVGAGMSPDGSSFGDHDGDGVASRAQPNDWRGIYLDEFSNDDNLLVLPELELLTEVPPGLNATVDNAQYLGELAKDAFTADHARRAGFEVHGYLGGFTDVDAYSFTASPGTPIWVDIDATTFTLDTVIEILDANGTVLARSDNSFDETAEVNPTEVSVFDSTLERDGVIGSLQAEPEFYTERNDFGLYSDFGSYNTRDAGIHLSLPGNTTDPSARSVYFVRVRSASLNPDDAAGGITGGHYQMQLRLTEEQAFPGSLVRFADIRYANHGIHAQGLMSNSPLLGEARENEVAVQAEFSPNIPLLPSSGYQAYNNVPVGSSVGSGAQYLGNLSSSQRGVLSVGGTLGNPGDYTADDIDFYQIDVDGSQSVVFDIDFADGFNRYDTNISIFYDEDGAPQAGDLANSAPRLIFFGSASNVLEDLPSALGANSELEQLVRGSLTNNDPFVGPVTLVEGDLPVGLGGQANRTRGVGTYYVAVTEGDRQPSSLTDGNVVREPINSVTRLVEDRFDDQASTVIDANSITVHDLFVPSEPGFDIGQDNDFGHGIPAGFVTTTVPNPSGVGETRVDRYHQPPLNFVPGAPNPISDGFWVEDEHPEFFATGHVEYDPDDPEITPPDDLDDGALFQWSLRERDTIGGPATALGGSVNTSTTIPHISLNGNLGTVDFYRVSLPLPLNVLTLDIDGGHQAGFESIDTKYGIFPIEPFTGAVLGGDISTQPFDFPEFAFTGHSGSEFAEDGMLGSVSPRDPFQQEILPQGTYLIAVVGQDS
ncbi:MAG: peptidase, partial [Rubripirellula sp.]